MSSGQEKIPRTDLTDCDSVLQSFGALHHEPTFKSRVSKGKENRGINSSTVDLSSDSDRPSTTTATNFRKSCRLPCDELREDGSTRKQFSSEVVISGPISNTMDVLASKMSTCASPCSKSYASCGRYFSCPRNFPKSSSVSISESSYSSVDETRNKSRDNDGKVNCSVIVVSDSSSTSSRDGTPQPQMKHLLSSSIRECKKGLKEVKCITIATSDSENDVLDTSFEAPHKLTLNVRTPLPSDLKFRDCSNTEYEKVESPVANLELTLSPKPLQLNHTKCRDIENWLSQMKPLKSGDYDDADIIPEGSSPQRDEVTGNDTKTSASLNSSSKESLDNLYEARCKINVDQERPQTEPCKKKFSRNRQISRQYTEWYGVFITLYKLYVS